jgi:hypothetical protein
VKLKMSLTKNLVGMSERDGNWGGSLKLRLCDDDCAPVDDPD